MSGPSHKRTAPQSCTASKHERQPTHGALRDAENGAVVTEFLKRHSEFEPYDLPETVGISHTVNEPKFMRTMMPMDHGGDGFFAAAMRRKTETGKETKR